MTLNLKFFNFFIGCLLLTSFAYGQKPNLRNINIEESVTLRDSAEIPLKEYNKILKNSGISPISKESSYVTPNETIWMSWEKSKPEESEDAYQVSVPLSEQPALLNLNNYIADEELEEQITASTSIDGLSFGTDASLSGFFHIPPDPSGAVGTSHVCHVVNTSIHCHTKAGVAAAGFPQQLEDFFSSLSPANDGFDPKILWDQYENRFVVVHLVKTQTSSGDASNSSRILLAVSATADPTGAWNFQAIDAVQNIGGNDCWFDYPGFAVDDKAIYITGNYFRLSNNTSCDTRIAIVDKGTIGGIYGGVVTAVEDPSLNPAFAIHDPNPSFGGTLQPAHVYGTPPTNMGTWLVSYSGLSGGGNEVFQMGRITNPLNISPTFSYQNIALGDIDDLSSMLDAPQSGNATGIETNDRRTLNAVWRNNKLWTVTQIMPSSGTNSGQTTAFWVEINETGSGTPTIANSGEIGGEDISAGLYTYMPSVAVNSEGNAGIVFSGSNASTFAGAYAVGIIAATGTSTATQTVKAGVDDYVRTFGGSENRYGDYTRMALDPSDDGFWAINQAAIAGGNASGGEDGQWQIFINEMESIDNLLPVELTSFDVIAVENKGQLKWTTTTERNNYGFAIEQYIGDNFQEIGFVIGAGTTLEPQVYEYLTENLIPGTYLFRLRQIDYDGMEYLSEVKSLKIEGKIQNKVTLPTPNPFINKTKFHITLSHAQQVLIQVFDINGRMVQSINEETLDSEQNHTFVFDGTNLSNGIYTIKILGENFSDFHKVILSR